jgi:hypothetical protein
VLPKDLGDGKLGVFWDKGRLCIVQKLGLATENHADLTTNIEAMEGEVAELYKIINDEFM